MRTTTREIKFRAWIPSDHWISEGKAKFIDNWQSTIYPESVNFSGEDGIVVEQFTGLHDRHGKEIYEGDIIDAVIISGFGEDFRIHGKIEYVLPDCIYLIIENGSLSYPMQDMKINLSEIVGNIHENPEKQYNKREIM